MIRRKLPIQSMALEQNLGLIAGRQPENSKLIYWFSSPNLK
ncbi:hypothetical protein LEP1GSC058_3263 [Leptospira fainei serovar Hurstbridge str. BUT 6]|uniref:Uncharacterized protein n=1 Tax=Leptospira fainei serovar Hurstbridge str. BUT 6 TaxID=1193011 RepID=S3UUK2_9LEPT|nr:hypothetical protein LEP1GSC058_3263 [Leptospira fainei serovar Hurstbridge str. BUT 6]